MTAWADAVGLSTQGLVALATALGGSFGLAIVVVSSVYRAALMPLGIALARKAEAQREKLARLKPEMDALEKRHSADPLRYLREVSALRKKHGLRAFEPATWVMLLLQLPVFSLLSGAIRAGVRGGRFLWISNLARPDAILIGLLLALTALASAAGIGVTRETRMGIVLVSTLMTALIVGKLSAGLGLYWAVSSTAGLAQSGWLRLRRSGRSN